MECELRVRLIKPRKFYRCSYWKIIGFTEYGLFSFLLFLLPYFSCCTWLSMSIMLNECQMNHHSGEKASVILPVSLIPDSDFFGIYLYKVKKTDRQTNKHTLLGELKLSSSPKIDSYPNSPEKLNMFNTTFSEHFLLSTFLLTRLYPLQTSLSKFSQFLYLNSRCWCNFWYLIALGSSHCTAILYCERVRVDFVCAYFKTFLLLKAEQLQQRCIRTVNESRRE